MYSEQREEAEDIFVRVIETGDCLPQPWRNLGISFVMYLDKIKLMLSMEWM